MKFFHLSLTNNILDVDELDNIYINRLEQSNCGIEYAERQKRVEIYRKMFEENSKIDYMKGFFE